MPSIINFILFTCCWLSFSVLQAFSVPVEAGGAVLINGTTGALLYEKNGDALFYPASLTQIATVLYIIKTSSDRLQEHVIAKQEALATITPQAKMDSRYRALAYLIETDASHIGIKRGEELMLIDLLYAMLLRSASDAANVAAFHLSGSIPAFMEGMNKYLKELGCTKTHFCNPHGLHHPDHVSTAREVALITKEAMQLPLFQQIVSTVSHTIAETNHHPMRKLLQTNLLLRSGPQFYPHAIGVKSGSSSMAGKALVAAASRPQERFLIGVVMGYMGKGDRYSDMVALFEAAFKEPKQHRVLLTPGKQHFSFKLADAQSPLKIYLTTPLAYDFYPSEKQDIVLRCRFNKLALPLEKDSLVGEFLAVDSGGRVVARTFCFAVSDVQPAFSYFLKEQLWHKGGKAAIFALAILFIFGCWVLYHKRSRRRI